MGGGSIVSGLYIYIYVCVCVCICIFFANMIYSEAIFSSVFYQL